MAVPMVLMYELSIVIARYVNPIPEGAGDEAAEDEAYEEDGSGFEEDRAERDL
jgi:Sec-independent protein secretion pathway component TatC